MPPKTSRAPHLDPQQMAQVLPLILQVLGDLATLVDAIQRARAQKVQPAASATAKSQKGRR